MTPPSYDVEWKPTKGWTVQKSMDPAIAVGDTLTFEGDGTLAHAGSNKVVNSSKGGTVWVSGFSYDSTDDNAFLLLGSGTTLVIKRGPSANPKVAELICEHHLLSPSPDPEIHPVIGPSGGTCWIAEEGG